MGKYKIIFTFEVDVEADTEAEAVADAAIEIHDFNGGKKSTKVIKIES